MAALLKKYNITKDTMVILYGAHPATERVAFCFLYCGVENVKVLNGSLTNWKNAGYEVETKVNTPVTDANYDFGTTVPAHPEYIVSKEELNDKLATDKNFRLVSIRSLDEFKGLSDGNYPMLQEKGEIAGAVFGRAGNDANTMEEYMNADGTLISYERFKGFMADSYVYPTNEVCFFCGTGWRATMPLLMAYEKGWKVSLYDGGWWQWTRDLEHNAIQMLTPEQARTCSSFEYTNMDVKLQVGDTYKNSDIHIFPASGTLPTVRFKSNNTNVATVDADGNVTAVGAGTVNIKMIATDFSGRNTSYTVTVTEKQAAQSTKKAEKTARMELIEHTKAAIEGVTDEQALELLHRKWVTPLVERLQQLPSEVVDGFVKRIQALCDKYASTLPDLDRQIRDTERELCDMLGDLTGNENDMAGIHELQRLLMGDFDA